MLSSVTCYLCISVLEQFYKQTKACRTIKLMIVIFVFYVDSISGFFSEDFSRILHRLEAEEPHNCFHGVVSRYDFCKGKFGVGSRKNKCSSLENSLKTPGVFLSSVIENHVQNCLTLVLDNFSVVHLSC